MIVDEVKPWGVQAYVLVPKSNDGVACPAQVFRRLTYGTFKTVGYAAIIMGATNVEGN